MDKKTFWAGLKTKIRKWIDSGLSGTHNHYFCYLPKDLSPFSSLLLKRIFSNIKVDQDQSSITKQLITGGIHVYVTKYKSYFEYLFYHTRYKEIDMPVPEIGLNYESFLFQPLSRIFRVLLAHADYFFKNFSFPDPYKSGYITQELIGGRAAILSLIERKGFVRRLLRKATDPVIHLIEMQKNSEAPITIIPQLMFFSRVPDKSVPTVTDVLFGTADNPGRIRRFFVLFKKAGAVFIESAEPINLKEFLLLPENHDLSVVRQSFALRRQLLVAIDRCRQSVTGPIVKTKEELKVNILTDHRLQKFMEDFSEKRNVPAREMYEKADRYLDEIAADFNPAILKFANRLAGFILNNMFDGIVVDSKEIMDIRNLSQKGPLILIPCHKSHIDYLILPYVLYNNNMPCPHAVAGKNLFFWPLGSLFRALGAFSIRRTFSGAVLYAKVFEEYIRKILEEGFNIELFFEGGRSRTGKLMMPKLGFLSILLNAFKKGACADMIFVPVFIGYDQVLEESTYLHEVSGGEKKPESLSGLIKAVKFLKKRYGKIYIRFHEPISLNQLVQQQEKQLSEMNAKEQNTVCRRLGYRVLNAINKVTVVTPHALVASAILVSPKNKISYGQLTLHVQTFMRYLSSQEIMFADTLSDSIRALENVLYIYAQRKLIDPVPEEDKWPTEDTLYIINEHKRPELEYYKNNAIAFFVPAAFVALAILEQGNFQFSAYDLHSNYNLISEFFHNEFVVDIEKTPEEIVQNNLQAFVTDNIITAHPTLSDTYNLTSDGLKKLKLFGNFLTTFFESYWIVLSFFKQAPRSSLPSRDRLKNMQSLAERMYKRMEIDRKEALSKITFENAEKYFTAHGIKGSEDVEKIKHFLNAILKYLNLLSW